MTEDYFKHLLPEIDRYYDRHRPNFTRAQWHDAWLKADGFDMEVSEDVSYTVWFVREYSEDDRVRARILAFSVLDELFSSEELYRKIGSWGLYEQNLEELLNLRSKPNDGNTC
jgi:hypothetical protein